ncbi:50S ribosomal protein L13 [Candidatus Pacearchaeota archaeon]|nr:50S ribosomal protein L13 [Candidatus Pacearchaeota archaeon]|tara:strand:+ start:560 stop:976 length:417 start_codon:yes stop_codon:yes gene_type:complete
MNDKFEPSMVIDATDAVLGRLASVAAKQALMGKTIAIVNCNAAVVTGRRQRIIKEYYQKRSRGGASQKGPFFPKEPFRIVKRTIRGMLSYKQGRGNAALSRIRCFNTVPAEYEEVAKMKAGKPKTTTTLTLKKLEAEI